MCRLPNSGPSAAAYRRRRGGPGGGCCARACQQDRDTRRANGAFRQAVRRPASVARLHGRSKTATERFRPAVLSHAKRSVDSAAAVRRHCAQWLADHRRRPAGPPARADAADPQVQRHSVLVPQPDHEQRPADAAGRQAERQGAGRRSGRGRGAAEAERRLQVDVACCQALGRCDPPDVIQRHLASQVLFDRPGQSCPRHGQRRPGVAEAGFARPARHDATGDAGRHAQRDPAVEAAAKREPGRPGRRPPSAFGSSAAPEAGVRDSAITSSTGPATPPASMAPASHSPSSAGSRTGSDRRTQRNRVSRVPGPRYSSAATIHGPTSASSSLARGALAPNSAVAARAAASRG